MKSLLCSVIITLVSSRNVIEVLLLAVVTMSLISIADDIELGKSFLSLRISVGPDCSVTLPTSALLVVRLNNESVARASNRTIND